MLCAIWAEIALTWWLLTRRGLPHVDATLVVASPILNSSLPEKLS